MKNVMTRAWEIAKQGQKKFGGKVKEYFSSALKLAWKEVKNIMEVVKFGFQEVARQNGSIYFVVNAIKGIEVSLLSKGKNFYNGKEIIKRKAMEGKPGTNNVTGQEVILHDVAAGNYAVEIRVDAKSETFEINNGKLNWI